MTAAAVDLTEVDKQARLDQLRRRIAAVPGRTRDQSDELFAEPAVPAITPPAVESMTADADTDHHATARASWARSQRVLPAPDALAALLPRGGLARGTVTAVHGAQSILVALVAATSAGEHAAVIGLLRFGLPAQRRSSHESSRRGARAHRPVLRRAAGMGEDKSRGLGRISLLHNNIR